MRGLGLDLQVNKILDCFLLVANDNLLGSFWMLFLLFI